MSDLYCEHERTRSACEDCAAAKRAPQPERVPVSGWLPENDDEAAAVAESKKTTRRRAQAPNG